MPHDVPHPVRPGAARRAVVLFARSPSEEARRKRLRRAERIFALTRDRVLRAAAALQGVAVVIVGDPGPGAALGPRVRTLPQRGLTFGERLESALEDVQALGFDAVVAVGLDAPGLTAADLAAAFERLERHAVVLGPAADGGVYLVGVCGAADGWAPGMRAVRWQTRQVLADLRRHCPGAALLARVLIDVDRFADLLALARSATSDRELLRLLTAALLRLARAAPEDAAPESTLLAHPISFRGPPLPAG